VLSYAGWLAKEEQHLTGSFEEIDGGLLFTYKEDPTPVYFEKKRHAMTTRSGGETVMLRKIAKDDQLYHELVMGYGECMNRVKYVNNDTGKSAVNAEGWGKGTVYLNFDKEHPIEI
jgi:hypothetical protein